jgi:hypothetical protein
VYKKYLKNPRLGLTGAHRPEMSGRLLLWFWHDFAVAVRARHVQSESWLDQRVELPGLQFGGVLQRARALGPERTVRWRLLLPVGLSDCQCSRVPERILLPGRRRDAARLRRWHISARSRCVCLQRLLAWILLSGQCDSDDGLSGHLLLPGALGRAVGLSVGLDRAESRRPHVVAGLHTVLAGQVLQRRRLESRLQRGLHVLFRVARAQSEPRPARLARHCAKLEAVCVQFERARFRQCVVVFQYGRRPLPGRPLLQCGQFSPAAVSEWHLRGRGRVAAVALLAVRAGRPVLERGHGRADAVQSWTVLLWKCRVSVLGRDVQCTCVAEQCFVVLALSGGIRVRHARPRGLFRVAVSAILILPTRLGRARPLPGGHAAFKLVRADAWRLHARAWWLLFSARQCILPVSGDDSLPARIGHTRRLLARLLLPAAIRIDAGVPARILLHAKFVAADRLRCGLLLPGLFDCARTMPCRDICERRRESHD